MPTLQQLAEIAARHLTRTADAMLDACLRRAERMGEPLRVPPRAKRPGGEARGGIDAAARSRATARDIDSVYWPILVEGNGDTRWMHV